MLNAKTQRPGVCNAAETLLVHEAVAETFLPRILAALTEAGVSVRADARTREIVGAPSSSSSATSGVSSTNGASPALQEAGEEDWASEYLALTLAVGVVDSVEQAIEHIARYGSGHSEAIVTRDTGAARAFQLGVDAACVYVNASTRFTDGGEFGMGAEIGNSTQKLHARGPIGLRELCTFKYLVDGRRTRPRLNSSDPVARIGILGGTFNPPHLGHVALARHARSELGLERVLIVPANIAPNKKPIARKDAGPEHRLAMCRLAVAEEPGVSVCALEIERGGVSYTVDTVQAIHDEHPDAELTLIVGADVARTLPGWREPARLLGLAGLAVAERDELDFQDTREALAGLRPAPGVERLRMVKIAVSSSAVRELIAAGEPVSELVGEAVAGYIAEQGLYRAAGSPAGRIGGAR